MPPFDGVVIAQRGPRRPARPSRPAASARRCASWPSTSVTDGAVRRGRGRADDAGPRRAPRPIEGIELVDGQTAEICLALDDWIAEAAAAPRGAACVVLIDYGAPAAELYDPVRRRDGTLRAYVRHQVHDDPYRFVGRQDLTAHVDVTAVRGARPRRPA